MYLAQTNILILMSLAKHILIPYSFICTLFYFDKQIFLIQKIPKIFLLFFIRVFIIIITISIYITVLIVIKNTVNNGNFIIDDSKLLLFFSLHDVVGVVLTFKIKFYLFTLQLK